MLIFYKTVWYSFWVFMLMAYPHYAAQLRGLGVQLRGFTMLRRQNPTGLDIQLHGIDGTHHWFK
jgi:hypothetical protein